MLPKAASNVDTAIIVVRVEPSGFPVVLGLVRDAVREVIGTFRRLAPLPYG